MDVVRVGRIRARQVVEGIGRLRRAARGADAVPVRSSARDASARAAALLALAEPLDGVRVRSADTEAGPMWLDAEDTLTTDWIATHGGWEPALTAFLRRHLRPGMHFVDVGANIGFFSVLASGIVGPTGSVLSVEPEPTTVRILRANLWRNGCDNAQALRLAAYSERSHIQLVSYPHARAGSWVDAAGTGGEGGVVSMVPCAPLDDLVAGRRVDVIKIDAEGVDHRVVAGMRRAWAENPGMTVVTELWTQQVRGGKAADEILGEYRAAGLAVSLLEDAGERPLDDAVLDAVRAEHNIVNVVLRRA